MGAAPVITTAGSGRARVGRWVAGGTVVLVALHLWIARGVTGPIVLQDESGYLGNARWLVGLRAPLMGDAPVYAWGYSLVIAPLTALVDDPALLYRSVQAVNSVLLASLLPLLWLVLRRVGGVDAAPAAIAAAVGAVFPATLVHSSTAWAENLLAPLTAVLVLAVHATLTERPAWQRVAVAPVAVWLAAAHPRFLPVLVLVVLGLVVAGALRVVPRMVAATGVGLALAGWVAARAVQAAIVADRWPELVDDEGSVTRLARRLLAPSNWPALAGGLAGESWYLVAGSLGLAAVGALAIGARLRPDPTRPLLSDPPRLTVAVSVVLGSALLVTSAVSFVGTAVRVDQLVYGRYNEAFAGLLVASGAAALLVARRATRVRLAVDAAAIAVVLGTAVWLGRGPDAFDGPIVWNNVLALRPVAEVVGLRWVVPALSVLTAVAMVATAVAVRRGLRVGPVVALGGALAVSGVLAVGPLTDFARVRYDGWVLPERLERAAAAAGVDGIGLARATSGLMAVHGYPFWSPDLWFAPVDGAAAGGLLVGPLGSAALDEIGARVVVTDPRNDQSVWALPGPALTVLDARGALLPPSFPAAVPEPARSAAVELLGQPGGADLADGTASLAVPAGGTVRLDLAVIHRGTGTAWVDDGSWPLPGVVRVGARWTDADGAVVDDSTRASLGALMWPGDRVAVELLIAAVDADGAPLTPGRYTLAVDLVQEGFAWFAAPGAEPLRLAVEVTPG